MMTYKFQNPIQSVSFHQRFFFYIKKNESKITRSEQNQRR